MSVVPTPPPLPARRLGAGAAVRRPRARRPRALVVHLLLVGAAVFGVPSDAAWAAGTGLASQGPKLTGAAASGFGAATALSADGATALVGSPGTDSVRVLSRAGGTWTTEATLAPSDADGAAGFGSTVALSADGTVALVGGPADADDAGAAWIFVGDGMTWTQAGTKLTAADEIGSGRLGASVALSASGGVAVVGAPSDDGSAGAVSV